MEAGKAVPPITRADCEALDRADPLRPFRDRFHLPSGLIYLDGNSLGAMPKSVPARIARLLEREWGDDLIRGWTKDGWMDLPLAVGAKIGSLIGAGEDETVVADSTSVNLFKVLGAALGLRPDRHVILSERVNFPTDLYIAQGLASLMGGGYALRLVERSEIEAALGSDIAVVMLTHADYRSGRLWDMKRITALAHQAGALTVWDFSHSAGVVPLDFDGDEADFAVGCGYKYLSGGPGAPAFLTIARRHLQQAAIPITGWLGHAEPFAFESGFRAAKGIGRARVGTPPILSLAALEVGVDIVREATVPALRAKSIRQTELFVDSGGAGTRRVWFRAGVSGRRRSARQSGQPAPRARLADHSGADRRECDRRFPRARHRAFRICAALCPLRRAVGRCGDTQAHHGRTAMGPTAILRRADGRHLTR